MRTRASVGLCSLFTTESELVLCINELLWLYKHNNNIENQKDKHKLDKNTIWLAERFFLIDIHHEKQGVQSLNSFLKYR